jgi:tetratricopeptide (TPR) repeat protein
LHIVLYARDKKLDGTIDFVAPDQTTTASLLLIDGEPAKARLSAPVAHLGAVLRDLGAVTDEELSRSLSILQAEKASGHSLHGELLLRQRLIDRTQLAVALREQMARKLRRVAAMPSGTVYGFYAGFDGLRGWGGDPQRGFDVSPMLWDILRDNPPEAHVKAGLARVESLPLRLSLTADVSRLGLGEKERAAAEFLRARAARVAELSAGGLDETESRLLAYLLLATRQLEVATPANDGPDASGAASQEAGESPEGAPGGPSFVSGAMPSALPPPALRLAPVYVHRWIEVVAQLRRMERADHFEVLGVGRDATRDAIEAAFVALAKKWHPDRLPPPLAPVREACSRVFGRMSEARLALVDDEERAAYASLVPERSRDKEAMLQRTSEAAATFQRAEICFKRNDLSEAESLCRKAIQQDPGQAEYRSLIAWLVALKPENQSPEKTIAAIRALSWTIEKNKTLDNAHLWRGLLFKRLGKIEPALKDFRRAVEINPNNLDAACEVRLHARRTSSATGLRAVNHGPASSATSDEVDPSKSGILDRLLRRG